MAAELTRRSHRLLDACHFAYVSTLLIFFSLLFVCMTTNKYQLIQSRSFESFFVGY